MLTFKIYKSGFIRRSWKYRTIAENGKTLNYAHGFNSHYIALASVELITKHMKPNSYKTVVVFPDKTEKVYG